MTGESVGEIETTSRVFPNRWHQRILRHAAEEQFCIGILCIMSCFYLFTLGIMYGQPDCGVTNKGEAIPNPSLAICISISTSMVFISGLTISLRLLERVDSMDPSSSLERRL